MTDLETQLHDTLHALSDTGRAMSGPALRRRARTRQLTIRGGSVVALGAAGTAAALVVPGLLTSPSGTNTGAVGATSAPTSAAPSVTAPAAVASAAAPPTTATAKPTPSAAAVTSSATPVTPSHWTPAGDLIDDPTVLADAPKVASTDSEWTDWTKDYQEGPLLAADTVHVVYAGPTDIYTGGTPGPRHVVIVTGRTAEDGPLQIAVLTSALNAADPLNLEAIHPAAASGPQAIAVYNGNQVYVAAEAGVDSATFTYTDNTGTHSAPMTVKNGIAIGPEPTRDLKSSPNGAITNVKAFSHGQVVWDAAPVAGR